MTCLTRGYHRDPEGWVQFLDPRLPRRFWNKCVPEPNSGCWIWTGATSSAGGKHGEYGKIRMADGTRYAHRVAYEALVGAIPADLQGDHLCRVRCCVNPAHIEPVSQRENIMRGCCPMAINAAKTHCPAGHELAGDNLVANRIRRGIRKCRKCKNSQGRIWKRDKRRRSAQAVAA